MNPIGAYKTAFAAFLAEGMTHAEALEQFDHDAYSAAACEELLTRGYAAWIDPGSLINLSDVALRETMNERDMEQAITLWLEGWTSEGSNPPGRDVFSWSWRRPSRRPGKPGRRYPSTNQAWNAMNRETKQQ